MSRWCKVLHATVISLVFVSDGMGNTYTCNYLCYSASSYNVNSMMLRTLSVLFTYGILEQKGSAQWISEWVNWTAAILLKDIRIKLDHCNEAGINKTLNLGSEDMGCRLGSACDLN